MNWMPIESAPRDRAVLVTFPAASIGKLITQPGVMVAYWDAYHSAEGRGYSGGSGWTDASTGDECRLHYAEPTHWMPLPPPPEEV
jgi:hypothetical protein